MHRRNIASLVLVVMLVGCGGVHLDPHVKKRLAIAKASSDPAYWLGPRYGALRLVDVASGSEAFFTSSLFYADCSWFDVQSLSPRCHHIVEIDNDVPASGEISTMGRCIFSTSVRGLTVATFPVNPGDLRVFARGATILVSSRSRSESLKAIAALKPLNGRPLVHRNVTAALGTCKPPAPKPPLHLSAKQRYERRMKSAFFIESLSGVSLNAVDFPAAARPKAVRDEFLTNNEVEPALLRNEADRIEKIQPPTLVASQHTRLIAALRAYASVLDEHAWTADRHALQPRLATATAAIAHAVAAFRARGYSIFVKPSD